MSIILATPKLRYSEEVLIDLPSHYWKLDEASGNVVDDIAAANGVPTGSPTYDVSPLINARSAISFNGSSQYITASSAVAHVNGQDFSWECWFKTTDGSFRLLDTRGTGPNGTENGFQISVISAAWTNTMLDDGAGNFIQMSGASFDEDDNNPHHIVCTFDTLAGTMRLYMDGALADTKTNSNLIGMTFNTSLPFRMAKAANSGSQYFNGTLDEVAIYDHLLNANRVATHYNAGI